MENTIKTNNAVWAGVRYFNGHAVGCSIFVTISRKRKYAYVEILRGDMELAGNGVAWVGNEPTRTTERVTLSDLNGKISQIIQGY